MAADRSRFPTNWQSAWHRQLSAFVDRAELTVLVRRPGRGVWPLRYELSVVERHQSACKWCIRSFTTNRAGFPRRGVEDFHRSRRSRTLPEGVHASAVEVLSRVAFVVTCVLLSRSSPRLPRLPSGWYGLTLGPPILSTMHSTGCQCVVANHFGVHPEPRASRQRVDCCGSFSIFLLRRQSADCR